MFAARGAADVSLTSLIDEVTVHLAAVTHDILGDAFWTSFARGLHEGARQVDCTLEHVRPERYTADRLRNLVDQVIASRPDGLLTTLPDPAALDAPLRDAIERGLPVIVLNTFDRRAPAARLPALCAIGADDREGGRLAAEKVLAAGRCRHALCVDHYRAVNVCHGQRIDGFEARLHEAGVRVSRVRVDGRDLDGAARGLEAALAAMGPELDAVLTLGPPGWAIADRVLRRRGLDQNVVHVTFDVTAAGLDAIEAGRTLGTIDCQQYLQGYLGVIVMSRYVTYGLLPCGDVVTGPRFVDTTLVPRLRARIAAGVA